MIIVTFNYRLNIFAFGDGVGEKNLALQDQRLAIQWVVDHIADFGGDHVGIPCLCEWLDLDLIFKRTTSRSLVKAQVLYTCMHIFAWEYL